MSPPKWARFFSYFNGASTALGWIFASSGTFVFTAEIWAATMKVRNPGWEVQTYQIFLITVGTAVVGVILNTVLFDYYPWVTRAMVFIINAGTLYVLVALLVRAHPKASAHTVFVEVINETGWDSTGLVFLLCFLPGCVAVACFDTAAHMSEEMDSPERQVPLVMIGGSLLCALTALPMIVVYLFCTVNPLNLIESADGGGQPIFQVFVDGFNSPALVAIAMVLYCITYLSSCPAVIATGSRLIWSFAKHGGMPFPGWLGHVDPKTQIPVNAVYFTATVGTLIGLLLFGPSTVLNGVFGAASVCFFFSYGMPIWLNVATRGRHLPSTRYLNLGIFSLPVNIAAICWQLITVVFLCFPLYRPVTPTSMNWASVCGIVGLVLAGFNWFLYAKQHFEAPKPLFVENLHGEAAHHQHAKP